MKVSVLYKSKVQNAKCPEPHTMWHMKDFNNEKLAYDFTVKNEDKISSDFKIMKQIYIDVRATGDIDPEF